jgi:hypothetical protein
MKLKSLLPFVIAAALALSAVWVIAQEGEEMTPEQKEMFELMMKYGTPGEGQKLLEPFIGEWNIDSEWWAAPGAPVQESEATSTVEWIFDGRYTMERVEGEMEGMPFRGMGIVGYDNYAQKYNSLWIDNMSTMFFLETGTANEEGNEFVLEGTYDDYITGEKAKPSRTVVKIVNENVRTSEMYTTTPDGEEYMTMKLTYTREM